MEAVTLVDGGHIEVINSAENLQIVFKEVGGTNLFTSNSKMVIGHNERYFGEITPILLPGQGFELMFIRQKEVPETAPEAAP
jgi:hypothetical protein